MALGALLLAGCSKGSATPRAPRLALTPCRVQGIPYPARCGTYEVFEDRAAKQGRKLKLRVVVVPALAPNPEPDPVVLLAGGPGQAASETTLLASVERLHRNRDFLLVDQRGTGASHPLDCKLYAEGASLAERLDTTFRGEALKKCLDGYDADVRLYTTPLAMDDLDEVRDALGYEKVNLWGISYGTRAALVYLRQHPERVRTVTLDGVAPMNLYLPLYMARDAQRALELVFLHCEKDAACGKAYPELRARVEATLERLKQEPARVRLAHPLTGVPEDVTLTHEAVTGLLLMMLYNSEVAALVPLVLDRATHGDWAPFVAAGSQVGNGVEDTLSQGMYLSVVCSEDVPFLTEEAAGREAKGSWFGEAPVRKMLAACKLWPRGTLPEGYREPVTSSVPTLLLSGELDPVTPPSWGEEAGRTLSRSLHVVVPGVGHNALTNGCVRKLMADFLDKGDVAGLSGTCGQGLARPPFFTSFAGPVP